MDNKIKMRRSVVLLALTVAVIAASVLVVERFSLRLDLSESRANTLSKVSRELYKEIPEQVRITYYISSTLAAKYSQPRAIEDFLRSLESASKGRIVVEIEDPSAGKGEAAAQSLGVTPRQMQIVEKSETRFAMVYSGIVVQYLDRTQVMPFAFGADSIEYDVVKAVRAAVAKGKPKAAILLGDSDKSLDQNYRNLSKALEQSGWDKEEVGAGKAIPPDAGVLLVLGNSSLDDYDVYRIDAYLASGGRALFAVKGVDIAVTQGIYAKALEKDALLVALEAYGAKVGRELVLDASSLTLPYQSASPYGGAMLNYVRYPHWIMTRPENRDGKNPLTSRLPGLDLFWPSPIELVQRQGVESQALVKTTPEAWLQKKDFAVGPQEAALYAVDADATKGQYLLAAGLSGVLPQAFAGKKTPERAGAEALPALPEKSRATRILVIGSSDFTTDYMSITESEFNASFIVGAADWLSSGDDLLALRSRGQRDTRFSKVKTPEAKSALATLSYVVNIGLVPAAVLVLGIARAVRRRRLEREEASARYEAPAVGAAPARDAAAKEEK